MARVPYSLTGPIGSRANLGVIVLQADEVIEQDFRRLFRADDVALYVTRIASGADLTHETLAAMEAALPAAAGLFPVSVEFAAVAYACTSGATVIGPDRVGSLVRGATTARHVTDPLTAAVEAFSCLGVRRIGLVSPYVAEVSASLRGALQDGGFDIAELVSFEEQVEARVARIDPESIRDAALEVGRSDGIDAVFLSCTNLRSLGVIADLEQELGKPVVSSNQALAWHLARLAGAGPLDPGYGRLMGAG